MSSFRDSLIELIEGAGKDYVKDLESLTTDHLTASLGGAARKGADFSYEVAIVNQRVAARLRGDDPGPWPFEAWATVPEEHASQEALIDLVSKSVSEVTEALASLSDEELIAPVMIGENETSRYKLASVVLIHLSYHDGQLNYIQSLNGDAEIHWV
jgi:hypothetical protein